MFVPTVAKQAERGKMKYVIGDGKNEMDFTYVGNVAQAHIEAAAALVGPGKGGASPVAGRFVLCLADFVTGYFLSRLLFEL